MNCDRFEKWISDAQDGELPEKKKRKLAAHLNSCSSCQAYKNRLMVLQSEAGNLEEETLAPEYWEGFTDRLQARLAAVDKETGEEKPLRRIQSLKHLKGKWNWRWATVSGFAAAALILVLLVVPPYISRQQDDYYIFSMEETMVQVRMEVGNDPDLEAAFNSLIQTAIEEEYENIDLGDEAVYWENPLEFEDLSEEELLFLEAEIKKEIKS